MILAPGGSLATVGRFKIEAGRIVEMDFITDPERLSQLDSAVLED